MVTQAMVCNVFLVPTIQVVVTVVFMLTLVTTFPVTALLHKHRAVVTLTVVLVNLAATLFHLVMQLPILVELLTPATPVSTSLVITVLSAQAAIFATVVTTTVHQAHHTTQFRIKPTNLSPCQDASAIVDPRSQFHVLNLVTTGTRMVTVPSAQLVTLAPTLSPLLTLPAEMASTLQRRAWPNVWVALLVTIVHKVVELPLKFMSARPVPTVWVTRPLAPPAQPVTTAHRHTRLQCSVNAVPPPLVAL